MQKPLTPVPALRKGMRLYPDDPFDPAVFRVDFSALGKGTLRVVFRGVDARATKPRLQMDGMSFQKRRDLRNPRPWATAALSAGAAALAICYRQNRGRCESLGGDRAT